MTGPRTLPLASRVSGSNDPSIVSVAKLCSLHCRLSFYSAVIPLATDRGLYSHQLAPYEPASTSNPRSRPRTSAALATAFHHWTPMD